MDQVERIPIDLGPDTEIAQAAFASGGTVVTQEDGSLLIDVLVELPCGESLPGEIVVCASAPADPEIVSDYVPEPEGNRKVGVDLGKYGTANLVGESASGPMGGQGVEVKVTWKLKF